jgi:hypothetical protein
MGKRKWKWSEEWVRGIGKMRVRGMGKRNG